MTTLDRLGATLGLACILALVGYVAYVSYQHDQQIDRLSTAIELPNSDPPVPVGYPKMEIV